MSKRLTEINITHISLVKAGANGKETIYKSAEGEENYERIIEIHKQDEQGLLYGIVYAPGEVDSQGDFADADEIKKAAYGFMKSLNATNVDREHSFESEDAFVAESWLVKGGDPIFINEPEGSWAVAIQLESEALRALAKSGEISGLSMAGSALRKSKKEEAKDTSAFSRFFEVLAEAVSGVWVDVSTYVEKEPGEKVEKTETERQEALQKKLKEAVQKASDGFASLQKASDSQQEEIAGLKATIEEQKATISELKETIDSLKSEGKEVQKSIDSLKDENTEITEALKKSKQRSTTKKKVEDDDSKGVI